MVAGKIAPRRPWLAGVLQVFLPGLGNLYSGRPLRGLATNLIVKIALPFIFLAFMWTPRPLNMLILVIAPILLLAWIVLDGVRSAKRAAPDYRLAAYNRWYVYVLLPFTMSLILDTPLRSLVETHVGRAAQIRGPAMEPSLIDGDHFLVDLSLYSFSDPQRGDIVAYSQSEIESPRVSRIVGMPADTIEIRDKAVFIDEVPLHEPYVYLKGSRNDQFPGDSMSLTAVLPDTYFLLGDNRRNSNDSRFEGHVAREQILGKLSAIYFSWDSQNRKIRWERMGLVVR